MKLQVNLSLFFSYKSLENHILFQDWCCFIFYFNFSTSTISTIAYTSEGMNKSITRRIPWLNSYAVFLPFLLLLFQHQVLCLVHSRDLNIIIIAINIVFMISTFVSKTCKNPLASSDYWGRGTLLISAFEGNSNYLDIFSFCVCPSCQLLKNLHMHAYQALQWLFRSSIGY